MTMTSISNSSGLKIVSWQMQKTVANTLEELSNMLGPNQVWEPTTTKEDQFTFFLTGRASTIRSEMQVGVLLLDVWNSRWSDTIEENTFLNKAVVPVHRLPFTLISGESKLSWQIQKSWEVDEKWAINEEDFFTLKEEDITVISDYWSKDVGGIAVIKDNNFFVEGRVLGFNKNTDSGRVMYVETAPGKFVYIDALTAADQVVGSLKFASDDPSFDDYDTNSEERKRNDFFLYDKDVPGGEDALDLQEIWNTDLMYLEDTQRTEKERDAFDWTGRENLQLGFGSLKFSWQIQEPEVGMFVKVIKKIVKKDFDLISVAIGTQGIITKLLDEYDLIQVLINSSSGRTDDDNSFGGVNILVDRDTFFDFFEEIDNKESSLKFSVDTYFDSSPAESNPVEESKLVNPIDDKHLRRTNPKRFDQRHDWYQESDSDISNRFDNAIQGDASLKFSWQQQPDLIIYKTHDYYTLFAMGITEGKNEDGTYNVVRLDSARTADGFYAILKDEEMMRMLYIADNPLYSNDPKDTERVLPEDIIENLGIPEVLLNKFSW